MNSLNVRKPFLKLLPIQIAAVTAGSVNSLIDTLLTSRYIGAEAVAGIGFFSPMLTVTYLLYIILRGTSILGGRAVGAGKRDEVTSLFSTALVLVTGYGLILGAGCFFLRGPLTWVLGARGDTAVYLRDYIAGYAPGIPLLSATSTMMMFLPCNNELKKSYLVMGIMVVSNTALDFLLVTGLNMGILGMGLATTVSYAVSTAVMIPEFLKKKKAYHFERKSVSLRNLRETIRLGLPELLFNTGVTARSYLLNLTVMKTIGAAGIAALNVENSLLCFLGAIPQGVGGAFTIMASIYYGERDRRSLKDLTVLSLKTGFFISALVTATLMAGSVLISRLFFPSGGEAGRLTKEMLLFFSSTFIFNTVFSLWVRLLQIEDHMKIVNTMNFMEQMFIAAAAIGGMQLIGVTAVWLAQPLAELLCLLTIGSMIRMRLGRIPRTLEEWMRLPEAFGAKDGDVLEYRVSGLDEVTTISETIMAFLCSRNIDQRTRTIVGLSVEEMAGNVIRYGTRDGKKHTVEIRLVAEDPLVVRVRDDCRAFDPTQWIDQFTPEDPAKNVGIRMVARLTKEMDYRNDAGINTLLMKIQKEK